MPRSIEITVPPDKTQLLIDRLSGLEGLVGLSLHRGVSLQPPGDVVGIQVSTDALQQVFRHFDALGLPKDGTIVTSEPSSLVAPGYKNGIDRETNEAAWEEIISLLRRETNLSVNYLTLMALAGAVAAAGLWTDTLHIVIGAMVIAPGFEPLVRIPLGLIGGPRISTLRGLLSTVVGYVFLVMGAVICTLALRLLDPNGLVDLAARSWIDYWSSVTPAGVIVSLCAGAAGTAVVAAQRSVLSAGVMVALALVPTMTIAGMAIVAGNPQMAAGGLTRWAVEAVCVLAASTVVLWLKQIFIHRRHSLG